MNYVGNSYKSKESEKEEKKLTPVAQGALVKKTPVKKFIDAFLADDISTLKTYFISKVLIPKLKDTAEDVLHAALYGQDATRTINTQSRTYYNGLYSGAKQVKEKVSNIFDYDNVTFETAAEANAVLLELEEGLKSFQTVSVADLYDVAGITTNNEMMNKYGWTSLNGASIEKVRVNGAMKYAIKMPRALPID